MQVKLDEKKKKETMFTHIVGGVHFEGVIFGVLLKYKQKTKKDKPEKTKKDEAFLLSFCVRLSSFLPYS